MAILTANWFKELGQKIKTQNNRYTDQPMFVVERRDYVVAHPDYHYDKVEWVNDDNPDLEPSETKVRRLEALHEDGRDTGEWRKLYLAEVWKFETCCFTEQGCKDFLEINGHNLGKTRIYAYGSFRNAEYQALRNHFISMAEAQG